MEGYQKALMSRSRRTIQQRREAAADGLVDLKKCLLVLFPVAADRIANRITMRILRPVRVRAQKVNPILRHTHGAALLGVLCGQRQNKIGAAQEWPRHTLRAMRPNVYAEVRRDSDGKLRCGLIDQTHRAGGSNLNVATGIGGLGYEFAQNTFRHGTTAGVAGANEENTEQARRTLARLLRPLLSLGPFDL